jgi:hypothetical protein
MFDNLCTPAYVILVCYIITVVTALVISFSTMNVTTILASIVGIIFSGLFQYLWIWGMNYLCNLDTDLSKGIVWFFAIISILSTFALVFGNIFVYVSALVNSSKGSTIPTMAALHR